LAAVLKFGRKARVERAGFQLYSAAVTAARDPWFYVSLGVPDTLDGRFDMVGLHVWLVIRNLGRHAAPGPDLAQAVFDAMFSDMDVNLREMGVGDLSVGKKNKQMWEAFHGRAAAYAAAMDDAAPGALAEALGRNVWRGDSTPEAAAWLAGWVRAQDAVLADTDLDALVVGRIAFIPPATEPALAARAAVA
jgi:cytochrome b pre-mRNA-processing protein 3